MTTNLKFSPLFFPVRVSLTIALLTVASLSILAICSQAAHAQTDYWGSASDGSWLVDANWLDSSKPTSADDVVIDAIGTDYRVDLFNSDASIKNLAISSSNATLYTYSGGGLFTLTASGGIEIFAGQLLSQGSYSFDAANGIVNHAGLLQSVGHTATQVHNGLTNHAAGEVKIRGVRNASGTATFGADLNVYGTGGFNNLGTVNLETSRGTNGGVFATLDVYGTLNNSGLIDSRPFEGAGAGGRNILADSLINSGTIVNNDVADLNLSKSQADYNNSGIINAAVGEVRIRSINSFVNQASGTMVGTSMLIDGYDNTISTASNLGSINLSGNLQLTDLSVFDNTGDIHVAGDFSFPFKTFEHRNGATLTGGNNLSMTNAILNLENGFTTDFTTVNLSGTTIQGAGTYASQSGTTTYIIGATVQSGVNWENSGEVNLQGTNSISANINGGFTNLSSGVLNIRGARSSSGSIRAGATLNIAGGVVNDGIIGFETSQGLSPPTQAYLDIAGTLTNTGLIESRPFSGGASGLRRIQADNVINSGIIVQNDTGKFYFNRSNATYSNSGSINVNSGKLYFQNFQSFSNSGDLNIVGSAEVILTGSSFTNEIGGTISGEGKLNSSVINFVDHGTLSPGSSPGVLTMQVNNYFQSTSGILDMEIEGLLAGIEYDQIVFSGNAATFNGTLRLTFSNGFAPSIDDEFDLLLSSNFTSNFQSIEILGLQPGFLYDTNTIGGSFTLVALNNGSAVPEPGALCLLIGVAGFLTSRRRRRLNS